jgi:RNA polymerase sigma factor (sigma-70 family)
MTHAAPTALTPESLAWAFDSLRPRLLAVAIRILRDVPEAEDAVQDGFVSAWRARASFRGECQVSTWLHSIVINAARMRLRAERRRRLRFLEPWLVEDQIPVWQARPATAFEEVAARDDVRLVCRLLPSLSEGQRAELWRTAWGARHATRSPASPAAKMRRSRARSALRSLIAAEPR